MSLSRDEQYRILREDQERRITREVNEWLALNTAKPDPNAMPADYLPNRHRTIRASEDSWRRGLKGRTAGIAPGTEDASDGTPTVAVWNLFQRHGVKVYNARRFGRTRQTARQTDSQPSEGRFSIRTDDTRFFTPHTELASE
jgi:hypothetical protein